MARLEFAEDLVHVKTAAVVGVQEGTLSRRKFMFQIDLEWSDESKTTSFRSYSDFFDLQCGLLSSFPREGGLEKGHERTLPFLPGKKLFSRSTRQLAEQRRPDIDDYVQKLTALPPHISRSDAVLSFFRSNWKEDRLRTGEGRGSLPRHGPAVKYSVEYSKTQSIGAKDELNEQWSKVNGSKQAAATSVQDHHTLTKEVITPAPKEGDKNVAQQTEPPRAEEGKWSSNTAPDNDAGGKGKLSEAIDMQEKGESEQ